MRYIKERISMPTSDADSKIESIRRASLILADGLDDLVAVNLKQEEKINKLSEVIRLILENGNMELELIPATEEKIVIKQKKKSKKRK